MQRAHHPAENSPTDTRWPSPQDPVLVIRGLPLKPGDLYRAESAANLSRLRYLLLMTMAGTDNTCESWSQVFSSAHVPGTALCIDFKNTIKLSTCI